MNTNKLSLNFFGEEISVEIPSSLSSLRKEISDKFLFTPEDAAEILVTYFKDLKKKFIKTEQDFTDFIKEKILKLDLDISPDSKIYQKSLLKMQNETLKDKQKLENLLKKNEEIKKKQKHFEEKRKVIAQIDKKVQVLLKKKADFEKKMKESQENLAKKQEKVNQAIYQLQKKLELPITVKVTPPPQKKPNPKKPQQEKKTKTTPPKKQQKPKAPVAKPKKIDKKVLKPVVKKLDPNPVEKKSNEVKKEEPKKEEEKKTLFDNVNEVVSAMMGKVNEIINNQVNMKEKEIEETEKKIHDSKIVLQSNDTQNFLNIKTITCNAKEEINKWTNFVTKHTNELTNLLSKKYQECAEFIAPLTDKLKKEEEKQNQTDTEAKEEHKGVMCDSCGAYPIVGNRYKCAVCPNFDYCEACEEMFSEEHGHPFIKIYKPQLSPIEIKCQLKKH